MKARVLLAVSRVKPAPRAARHNRRRRDRRQAVAVRKAFSRVRAPKEAQGPKQEASTLQRVVVPPPAQVLAHKAPAMALANRLDSPEDRLEGKEAKVGRPVALVRPEPPAGRAAAPVPRVEPLLPVGQERPAAAGKCPVALQPERPVAVVGRAVDR